MNLEEKDKKYIWHPFTQMKEWEKEDILIIEKGKGSYLYDREGKKYIDGVSSLWCNIHGHRVKEIDNAIKKQLAKIAHSTFLGLSNVPAICLAEKLISIAPKGLTRVFYSEDGSEAVEIALKIAFQYWQQLENGRYKSKTSFLKLKKAYHGDTLGSVSVGGIELFHSCYKPLLFETTQISPTIEEVEYFLKKYHEKFAAFILEPLIQCAGGMILQPKGFLKEVRKLTTKYNVLLIVDEVATGFGRTGKMFAVEHENITPDIMAIGKGLTGGYLPLAATLTTEKIFRSFLNEYPAQQKTFYHGHTYTANPIACAAAISSLELFQKNKILLNLKPKITYLKNSLSRFWKLENVKDIRQLGFMAAIELRESPSSTKFQMKHIILEARKRGAILRPLGNIIVLMPPLVITKNELAKLLSITFQAIKVV